MTESSRLQIIGLGASTPIGRNVMTSTAAARAGVCGFCEHPFMIDTAGEPMRVAQAPWLDIGIDGVERYCELLFPAMDEALMPILDDLKANDIKIGLSLALPPSRPGQSPDLAKAIMSAISTKYAELFVKSQCFEAGHAAGHLALEIAIKNSKSDLIETYVVAGVDSYLEPETLEWLEDCDQLHGGGPLNNAWGFIPGEAASAILVTTGILAQQFDMDVLGELVSLGLGQETNLIKTDGVCIGEGLTQAFRTALAELNQGELIHNVFCDLNGEKYRADEYGFTTLRTKDYFRAASDFIALADCWGDIGAAGVPLHIAQAVISNRKRYSKGPLSLIWASSESGERGVAVIRAIDPRTH